MKIRKLGLKNRKLKSKKYKIPPTSPLGIFLDKLRRRDLNGLQTMWVGLMVLTTAAGLALLQSYFGSYLLWLAKGTVYIIGIAVGTAVAGLIIWATFKGLKKVPFSKLRPQKAPDFNSLFKRVLDTASSLIKALGTRLRIKKSPEVDLKVKEAPGTRLLSIVEFLYSQKTVEEVFKPIIADWRTEYFDALKQNRTIKARWISVRYKYRFVLAMGIIKVYSFVRNIISAGR